MAVIQIFDKIVFKWLLFSVRVKFLGGFSKILKKWLPILIIFEQAGDRLFCIKRGKHLVVDEFYESLAVENGFDCRYLFGVFTLKHSFQLGLRLLVPIPELQKVNYADMINFFAVARDDLVTWAGTSLWFDAARSLELYLIDLGLAHVELQSTIRSSVANAQ